MVKTTQIKPSQPLLPYIHCYSLREFNSGNLSLTQPLHAMNECYLTFFLKDKFCIVNEPGKKSYTTSSSLCSLFTSSKGYVHYKGDFKLLSVQFKVNGFFAIFGIPQREVANSIISSSAILGDSDYRWLNEQLEPATQMSDKANILNAYFTRQLSTQKHKYYTPLIAKVSDSILKTKGQVAIDSLAYYANMSMRNFERRFAGEVGMSPKLYSRITRFFLTVENKMMNPEKNWTDITHASGYFDQAHFIRECKEFSSKTPEELFKFTPPPTEDFVKRVDH